MKKSKVKNEDATLSTLNLISEESPIFAVQVHSYYQLVYVKLYIQ